MKKGAMFGLDARIALSIFGVLSLISGASLYTAIENSKMTAMYASIKEIEKALEHMYLDTGQLGKTDEGIYDIRVLVTNQYTNFDNWDGPYISSSLDQDNFGVLARLYHDTLGNVTIYSRDVVDLDICNSSSTPGPGDDKNLFKYFIKIDDSFDDNVCNGNLNFLRKMHDKFDLDGDYTRGKIRVAAHGSNTGSLFYSVDLINNLK